MSVAALLLVPGIGAALLALNTLVVKPTNVVSVMNTLLRSSISKYGPEVGCTMKNETAVTKVRPAASILSRAVSR